MASRRYHALPVAVGFAVLASMVVHLWGLPTDRGGAVHVVGVLFTLGGSGLGLVYLGLAHADVSSRAGRRSRLLAWMLGSGVVFVGVGVVTVYLGSRLVTARELLEVMHVNGGVGLFVGHVMGVLEARGLARAETAARESARADALQAERSRAEKLNDLLRHYILNGVSVIDGYAASIAEDGEYESEVAVIRDRAESMAMLVENVHALTVATDDGEAALAVDVSTVLRQVATDCEDERVRYSVPEEPVAVRTSGGLEQAIDLLLDAVVRVVDDDGTVSLACDPGPQTVRVTVSGSPGALSQQLRNSVFEPVTAGVGLELYLVTEFLGEDASVEAVDTGAHSDTVTFAVDLQRVR